MRLFSGTRPATLGVKDGRLAPPNARPNNVHSQIDRELDPEHYIAPLAIPGDPDRAFAALVKIVGALERATIVTERADYLHVETASKTMGFVDDNEFYLDRRVRVIHVRAAARLGVRDFNANRDRIELIRAKLAA
jgi:uncharacterized protein (DUF1499 family)